MLRLGASSAGTLRSGIHCLAQVMDWGAGIDRDVSLIRTCAPLGSYSRTVPRALWWSEDEDGFL